MSDIYLSVVIPVFNEAENLPRLYERLKAALEGLNRSCEILFVDDGSTDATLAFLREKAEQDPNIKAIEFTRNFGQHAAISAGFEQARGEVVITLDADLQNPPEEIPNLLAKIEEGYDVVGGWRQQRQDSWLRKIPSRLVNKVMSKATGVVLKDYGCMLRAYRRSVVESMVKCSEISSFVPALANTFARSVTEIPVGHQERESGESKYSLMKLIRLNFDLMTGFSLVPIQMVTGLGIVIALIGILFGLFLLLARLLYGAEWAAQGVFTLFAILFVFVGIQIFALGMIGEYVGRIYAEVRKRPRFIVRNIYGRKDA